MAQVEEVLAGEPTHLELEGRLDEDSGMTIVR